MRIAVILLLSLPLRGCVHDGRGAGGPAVGAACPPLKTYSAERQRAVGAELKACGAACKGLAGWIKDYYVLRQQVRACRPPA